MSGFMQEHTAEWIEWFQHRGYPNVKPLAAGVEGAIYRLGDGTVAKVWGKRREPELLGMQKFYADVSHARLPFATPVILRVEQVDGIAVTFEQELIGEPLQKNLGFDDETLDPVVVECVEGVIESLRLVPATDAMRGMAVLDEGRAFWAGHRSFQGALVALLERRVAKFAPLLREHVLEFDRRYAKLVAKIETLDTVPSSVIHGDLFAENILVDEDGRPTAVLDFGFLSTAGDPRLDAAVTAVIMNMYGPHATTIAAELTDHFATRLGYPVDVLLVYQAAYAVATANVFTSDGSDGHFPWCVAQLTRPEVAEALDL